MVNEERLALPEYRLIHKEISGVPAKAGKFWLKDFGIEADSVKAIVVGFKKTRTFWGRKEILDQPPVCSSDDGLIGWDGKNCYTCEYFNDAPWMMSIEQRKEKCNPNYLLLCIDQEKEDSQREDNPFVIRASGIDAQTAKRLHDWLRIHPKARGQLWAVEVEFISEQKNTKGGLLYALSYKVLRFLLPEERKGFAELATGLRPESLILPSEEEAEEEQSQSYHLPLAAEAARLKPTQPSMDQKGATAIKEELFKVAPPKATFPKIDLDF